MAQTEILKQVFSRGESLTVGEALMKYGIYALSQRVGELKREGFPVKAETLKLPSGKRVSRYFKSGKLDLV